MEEPGEKGEEKPERTYRTVYRCKRVGRGMRGPVSGGMEGTREIQMKSGKKRGVAERGRAMGEGKGRTRRAKGII